jgi:hypothetical protein
MYIYIYIYTYIHPYINTFQKKFQDLQTAHNGRILLRGKRAIENIFKPTFPRNKTHIYIYVFIYIHLYIYINIYTYKQISEKIQERLFLTHKCMSIYINIYK